jgi:hypothetical protein
MAFSQRAVTELVMKFYVLELEIGSTHDTTFDEMEPIHRGEVEDCRTCPTCGRHVGSLPWLPPFRAAVIAHGRELGDVAFFGMDILVSEKFRLAWTEAQLKGIEAFQPLERVRVRPARLGRKTVVYYHVETRRFGARVDLKRSLIEYDKPFSCMMCMDAGVDSVRGFKIDESSWTGEDIFIPWGKSGSVIVTDRVRQLRDDYDLKNVTLTPTEEYFLDFYKRWTPIDYSRDDVATPDEGADQESTSLN